MKEASHQGVDFASGTDWQNVLAGIAIVWARQVNFAIVCAVNMIFLYNFYTFHLKYVVV
mgnify:CR=1|tara:strand:+ start:369 stop:545 length:177 start_codon:yes stop_codon:yes gene_type:complete